MPSERSWEFGELDRNLTYFRFSWSYSLLTLVWPKSTGTTGQGNTYPTEKTKISLAQLDMPASMHTLALSRGECNLLEGAGVMFGNSWARFIWKVSPSLCKCSSFWLPVQGWGKSEHLICFLKRLCVLQTSGGCSAYYFGFLKAKPYFDVGLSEALHT